MHQLTITGTAQHFIQSFSWMLIHSLWQGLLLAVVTGLILMLTKRAKAALRYNLVFVQFLLFIMICAITFLWEWTRRPLQTAVPGLAGIKAASPLLLSFNAAGIKVFTHTCITYFTANAPLIVLIWCVFFIFRAVRMMGSLVYIHRAKHHLVYQPANEWKEKVNILCEKLHLKRAVQLLESGYVKMPMVIGHLKPIILVPVGLLAGLPAGQVEAILLHELAHIRRHDYIVNFLQTLAETVFFFNPSLLWISSLLRDERENCCDDIALEQTKNKREFIEALISFKEHSLYGAGYEVAFPGKKNHLLNRISRILNNRNKTLAPAEKAFFMAGVIALSAMVTTAAIAGVHTAASRHSKHLPVATTSAPLKAALTVTTGRTSNARIAKRVPHISEPRLTRVLPTPAAQLQSINLAEAIDKLRADQARLTSVASAQTVVQQQKKPALSDQEQGRLDQIQARKDQEEARKDQTQALIDQEEARKDQAQALIDQEQAKKDQIQARKDQEDAKKQQQIEKQRQDADLSRAQKDEEDAKRNQVGVQE